MSHQVTDGNDIVSLLTKPGSTDLVAAVAERKPTHAPKHGIFCAPLTFCVPSSQ
jgi:hypothetical protein